MNLKDAFTRATDNLCAENDFVLRLEYSVGGYNTFVAFDFLSRLVTVRTSNYGEAGCQVLPFSQIDRETLDAAQHALKQELDSDEVPDLPAVEKTTTDFGKPGFSSKGAP